MDSSAGDERVATIEVGELGAEPEVGCRLSEERVLIMFVVFFSAVRKSSTVWLVRECNRIHLDVRTFGV